MPAKLFYTGPSLSTLHEDYAKKSLIDEQAPLISGAASPSRLPDLRSGGSSATSRAGRPGIPSSRC
jgi:hypothetical protein